MKKDICAICRVMLAEHNRAEEKQTHFHKTCIEHEKYARTFLFDVVSENLGFKDIEKDRECEVCKKILTNEEIQGSLKENSFNFLCQKHLKKYAKLFIIPDDAK